MWKRWQVKTYWPETDEILEVLGSENREQQIAMQASIETVLEQLRDRPEVPAIFQLFEDW